MGRARNYAVVIVFVLCSTYAIPLENNPEGIAEINSTEILAMKQEIARRKAYNSFILLSPYSRHDCLDSLAAVDDNYKANELMDMALEYLRNQIRNKNLDRVEIPKFQEGFSKKIGFVTVKGSFEAYNGWLESTLSIVRKGNANVRLDGPTVQLDSTLGLNILQLGMEYNAKLAFIRVNGNLDARVRSNAVSFSGGLDYSSGTCRLYLKSMTLRELGKIDVHATGLGKLNWLYSKIVTWVTSRLHDKIKDTIENKLRNLLETELAKIRCPLSL